MSHYPDHLTAYTYQYYGRSVYTQQCTRGLNTHIFTTIVTPHDPRQRCDSLCSSVQGEVTVRHEFTPSRFGSCPDVLFITCPEPCTFLCNEDIITLSSPYTPHFTTSQPPNYGAHIIPLPAIDIPLTQPEPPVAIEPYQYPAGPSDRKRHSGLVSPDSPRQERISKRRRPVSSGDQASTLELPGPSTCYSGHVTFEQSL